MNLGNALSRQQKYAEAEAEYREAIRLKPNDAGAHYRLGLVLNDLKKHSEAEVALQDAIRLTPNYPEAYYNLGYALQQQGKYVEAEAADREAIRLRADYPGAYYGLAYVLGSQGKNAEAEAAIRECIHFDQKARGAHVILGVALINQAKYAEAEAAFRHAVDLDPSNWQAYKFLGYVLSAQGKSAEAETAYRESVQLNTEDPEGHSGLGQSLVKKAEVAGEIPPWDDAFAEFVKAIDLSKDTQYQSARVGVWRLLAQWPELFDRVAKIRPDETAPLVGRAEYRARLSQWTEAAADYSGVIHSRPTAGDETVEYAFLLLVLGDVKGYQNFCKELVTRPGEPRDDISAFQMARACSAAPCEAVEPSRLVQWATQAAATNAQPWHKHVQGLAYYRAGQFELAIEKLKESNESGWKEDPAGAQNWLVLAMAHQRLGHDDEAHECLITARKRIEQAQPKKPSEPIDMHQADWIPIQVLSRKAEALLKGPAAEPKTNATDNEK